MELKQLEYFLALCETQNITKASEKLYLSRQSLSASIKHLEEELGVPLFERKKEGVTLTEYGDVFYTYVKKSKRLMADCLKQIDALKKQQKEIIHIGMPFDVFSSDMIRRIFSYEETNPSVSLEMVENDSSDYWAMILGGKVDVAYTVRPPKHLPLKKILLHHYDQCLILNKNHPLASQEVIDFQTDLSGQTLLESEFRMQQYKDLLNHFQIKVKNVTDDRNIIKAMISRNKGCIILLPHLATTYLDEATCIRPIINMPKELDLDPYLVFSQDASPNVKDLVLYLARLNDVEITSDLL